MKCALSTKQEELRPEPTEIIKSVGLDEISLAQLLRLLSNVSEKNSKDILPLWEKPFLTLSEAAAYTNVGMHKLCELADDEDCDFIMWVGRKRIFKRERLEEYLMKAYSI